MKDEANPKDLLGASKPQMGLIPVAAMESVARVMELGAKKYGPYNWRTKKVKKLVYAHAALRHLFAWIGGQSIDPESGQSHMAHVAACMMIVLDAEATGNAIDDREWPTDQNRGTTDGLVIPEHRVKDVAREGVICTRCGTLRDGYNGNSYCPAAKMTRLKHWWLDSFERGFDVVG